MQESMRYIIRQLELLTHPCSQHLSTLATEPPYCYLTPHNLPPCCKVWSTAGDQGRRIRLSQVDKMLPGPWVTPSLLWRLGNHSGPQHSSDLARWISHSMIQASLLTVPPFLVRYWQLQSQVLHYLPLQTMVLNEFFRNLVFKSVCVWEGRRVRMECITCCSSSLSQHKAPWCCSLCMCSRFSATTHWLALSL